jgi:radical SAM/Cys-rich protein
MNGRSAVPIHLFEQDILVRRQQDFDTSCDFDAVLMRRGLGPLHRAQPPRTLQVNVGKLCNQACHHCHVDASPKRTEVMSRATAERVLELLTKSTPIRELDLTGGAPELNPNFKLLVEGARAHNCSVIVRCNLTVLFEPGMEALPDFYCDHRLHLICSLPCYSRENVEQQRGAGVFSKSIQALQRLNRLGYGRELKLDLVYNPVGPWLPPVQEQLEARYRDELGRDFGIAFHRLLTITNMPINRFARQLRNWGKWSEYMSLLVNHFNPATVEALMCHGLISVSWDGRLFDCDFNQMVGMPIINRNAPAALTIWEIDDLSALSGASIATGSHCFGCTAGAGSSCGGALA